MTNSSEVPPPDQNMPTTPAQKGDFNAAFPEIARNWALVVAVIATGLTLLQTDFVVGKEIIRTIAGTCCILGGIAIFLFSIARFLDVAIPSGQVGNTKRRRAIAAILLTVVFAAAGFLILTSVVQIVRHAYAVTVCTNPKFVNDAIIQGYVECSKLKESDERLREKLHNDHFGRIKAAGN